MDSQKGFYPLEKMSFFLYNDVRHFQFPCSDMGIAVISDRFFYFVSVVLFSATQPQTSGLFWQLFLHPLLKPQSAQHTLPRLRSQLKILHFLAFDFFMFYTLLASYLPLMHTPYITPFQIPNLYILSGLVFHNMLVHTLDILPPAN